MVCPIMSVIPDQFGTSKTTNNNMCTSCSFKHVRNKLSSNRRSASVLLVLAGIWKARHDSCDPFGRRHLTRADSDEEFHKHIVYGFRRRLKDEDISFPHGSFYRYEGLAIGESGAAKCLRAHGITDPTNNDESMLATPETKQLVLPSRHQFCKLWMTAPYNSTTSELNIS